MAVHFERAEGRRATEMLCMSKVEVGRVSLLAPNSFLAVLVEQIAGRRSLVKKPCNPHPLRRQALIYTALYLHIADQK